jgi:hypothetical protein
MDQEEITKYILDMPDDVLRSMKFSMPWQYESASDSIRDEDGFSTLPGMTKRGEEADIYTLQEACFDKFGKNPYVNTAIRGHVGRIVGLGFETTSEVFDIQEEIESTETDPRNRLYYFWPKYLTRFNIEGELFLGLTLHDDGFVEVDFFDPASIKGGGDLGCGIFYHPKKAQLPLFYYVQNGTHKSIVPSIFVARYPELAEEAVNDPSFISKDAASSRAKGKAYKNLGGFRRFIVSMDKGFVTRRAVSYLRTTLEWLNHYENLKKYEIDHKKSSGAYLWVFSFEDVRAFKTWLTLSEDDKRKTGIGSKITPGSRLVLPPGMTCEVKNPNLSAIKDQDTDILHMVSGGLNEPEDIMSGAAKGTYASVKASRGPMSDRISDEIAYFKRWYINDFWGSIFHLKAASGKMKSTYKVKEAVEFDEEQEPVFKNVQRKPETLIDVSFPISEALDYEKRTGAILGVKHGPMGESLGIPNSVLAGMLGFSGYGRYRLQKATEDEKYPELIYAGGVDTLAAESTQEKVEGEPSKPKPAPAKKKMVIRKPGGTKNE